MAPLRLNKRAFTIGELLLVLVIVMLLAGISFKGVSQLHTQLNSFFSLKRTVMHHQLAQMRALETKQTQEVRYDLLKQQQLLGTISENYQELTIVKAAPMYRYNSAGEVNRFDTLIFETAHHQFKVVMHIKWGRMRLEKTERFYLD